MYAKTTLIAIIFMLAFNKQKATESQHYEVTLEEVETKPSFQNKYINKQERNYLARIIYAEGSVNKKDYYAIAHVVMVRAKYKNKSVIEIISNKKQFNGYKSKKWFQNPPREAYIAAELALLDELWDIYPANMYYFHNPKTATNRKWVKYISKYSLGMIGDHEFCYNHKM